MGTKHSPVDFFLDHTRHFPDTLFLLTKNTHLTFSELHRRVCCRAAYFRDKAVRPGTRVAIYTNNYAEMVSSFLALWEIGAVFMPMNISQPQQQIKLIESIVTPDIAFTGAEYARAFETDFPSFALADAPATNQEPHTVAPDDLALIMFTSGTSGVPKAVPMTFRAITSNAALTANRLKISPKDRLLINSPPYYTSPILHILTMLVQGGSVVAETGFLFGDTILSCLGKNGCTGFGGVPVHFTRILAALEKKQFPDTMRFLMNSGEHLPVPLILQLRNKLPEVEIFCVYGLTEVAGRLCILDAEMLDQKVGSVGKPLDGMTVQVFDESGDESPPGEQGEVFTKGTCLMSGYLSREDLNRGVMTAAGFATGDIGYLDENGFLFLVGRRDDIIKVGAEKVSVKMIEQSIYGFSCFADFMVAPKWDEHMGTVPCVYYVLKRGERFVQEELISHLKGILPKSHIPAHFIEVEEIPRSTSGKIIKLPSQNNNKFTKQKN